LLITDEPLGYETVAEIEGVEAAMEQYLKSEIHERFVQERINKVLLQYPNYSFDAKDMLETANTLGDVREKFDSLRELNSEIEQALIDSDKYIAPEKARNVHLSNLASFMYAYVNALKYERETELKIILTDLPAMLNDEYGNLTELSDVPRFFFEGIGKGIGVITTTATKILSDVAGGVASGLGLEIDKELLIKIGIGAGIGVVLLILGLIGFQYSKTYIGAKAKKRAES